MTNSATVPNDGSEGDSGPDRESGSEDGPRRPSAYRTSDRHAAVRKANRTETAEDYVEAIADLILESGTARVRDLAACFGVSHVTVSRTVDRLQRDGLVVTAPYRSIELTPTGAAVAAHSKERHSVVLNFLLALGISPANAELDAEGMEHHVGEASLDAFRSFVASRPASGGAAAISQTEPLQAQAGRFQRVRAAHATELVEDYVEAISDLIQHRGEARVADLARHFGVSHVTVSRTMGRLQRDGFVTTEPYRPVLLTPKGSDLAHRSRRRHKIVLAFFCWLGIPAKDAEIDAEGVEHHVGEETLQKMNSLASPPAPS